MRPILEDHVNQRRLREGHEPETPGASGFAVLHHDAVDDLPVAGEVTLQVLLWRLPWQTTDEQFSTHVEKKLN